MPRCLARRVWERDALYNNSDDVAASPAKSLVKLAYYHCLALVYGAVGACAQVGHSMPAWDHAFPCGLACAPGVLLPRQQACMQVCTGGMAAHAACRLAPCWRSSPWPRACRRWSW